MPSSPQDGLEPTPNSLPQIKAKNHKSWLGVWPMILIIGALVALAGFGWQSGWLAVSSNPNQNSQTPPAAPPPPKPPVPVADSLSLNTYFGGDIFWGRYMDDWSNQSDLQATYPFSGLDTFGKKEGDIWIANLECPITDTHRTSAQQEALLKFNCPPEYTPEAAKWFEVFSLANNHTDNMEEVDGFKQTRQYLEKNQIQYFGHYDHAITGDVCEVVSLPAQAVFQDPEEQKLYTELLQADPEVLAQEYVGQLQKDFYIPIALCGYHNVFKLPTQEALAQIEVYSQYFPTIVMPHQGAEYIYKPDNYQTSYYRQMIDYGADAVIGGHNHSVMSSEAYKGKLIAYGVGNFIFDQQFSAQVTRSLLVNLDFSFTNDDNLQQWLEFSQTCQEFKDDCLTQAKERQLKKPKFTINYGAVAGDSSNKLTKKADIAVTQWVLDVANWPATEKKLEE
jgi:hypothetical protein